jgi:SAM-dependent methyltransferase
MRDILKGIPDKRQDKNTTSLKFKKDLIEFFGEDYKDKICLEIGTSKGYSTRLLSFLFKKVITCEINPDLITFAKNINKDRENIEFLQKDVYGTRWDFEDIDVVFIDCDHEISAVLRDIQNAISLCKPSQELLIVFDDYGLDNPWEGVKDAISRYEDNPYFEIIKEIGEPKGSDCNPRANLLEVEGVICRYTKSDMLKNIVFIPDIDLGDDRNKSYSYSINSWKHFCDKYNCELVVWNDLLLPVEEMKITWQRYYMFDILEANHIDYDQILIVDADTIVHPDCPNFFNETDGKYSAVRNNGSFEWVRRSMDGFSKILFDDEVPFKVWDYINCGFQIVNKNHKEFFEYVRNYYLENQHDVQNAISQVKAGTDQTIINFLLRKQNIELNYLSSCYNLQDLHSKQLLFIHPQMWFEDKLIFENCGYVFHFNAIPPNEMGRDANYWIKRTYEEFYK